jgi:hypothetical protein
MTDAQATQAGIRARAQAMRAQARLDAVNAGTMFDLAVAMERTDAAMRRRHLLLVHRYSTPLVRQPGPETRHAAPASPALTRNRASSPVR